MGSIHYYLGFDSLGIFMNRTEISVTCMWRVRSGPDLNFCE